MISTMTSTELVSENAFHLNKPSKSIFNGLSCREFPNFNLLYGFISNKMGMKVQLKKKHLLRYGNEHTHYRKYLKNVRHIEDIQYIAVEYHHAKHGFGRIQADDSLSMSLFKRVTRHSFCINKYIDVDMENCHLKIFFEKAKQIGLTYEKIEGLITYCQNPKYWRQEIIKYYGLKDRLENDGTTTLAKDQAKSLTFVLAFGGGIDGIHKWKHENNIPRGNDLPIIKKLESSLLLVREEIWNQNQHIVNELIEIDENFRNKDLEARKRSLTGIWAQTWERIIQEECIAFVVNNYKVQLRDIIPSQDGMMLLKEQCEDIDFNKLFQTFNHIIKKKYSIDVTWCIKEFDEAINIPSCSIMPIDITFEDLEKGERHISELIAPAFKSTFKYFSVEKENYWYILTNNIWVKNIRIDEYRIIKILQNYIEEEILRLFNKWKEETNEDKKKELSKKETATKKHYEKVGKGNYVKQLTIYLSSLLKDNKFPQKLDKTAGKFVFNDCILDLKTGMEKSIVPEDYISFTNDINYHDLSKPDLEKRVYLKNVFKKIYNNKDTHLEYGLSALGFSLTGESHLEKAIFCLKDGTDSSKGNNGKSFIFAVLRQLFPNLVASTNYKVFEEKCSNPHKYIKDWRNIRILYCDEGSNNKVSAELVKIIGDGRELTYEVMFGYTDVINIHFKLFLCSNKIFNVGKDNDAVFNRYREMIMCSSFDIDRTEDDYDNLKFIADTQLIDTLLVEYRDELIHMFIDYAKQYYEKGLPALPVEFAKATAETKMKNNDFAVWFWKYYEIGDPNDRISMDEIMKNPYQGLDKESMIKEIKNINLNFNKELKGFGKKKVTKKNNDGVEEVVEVPIRGGIECIRKKTIEEE